YAGRAAGSRINRACLLRLIARYTLGLLVVGRVGNTGLLKALLAQAAAIAFATGFTLVIGLITGHSQAVINPQGHALLDDIGLAQVDQRGANMQLVALSARPGSQVCHHFISGYVFGATIRIA